MRSCPLRKVALDRAVQFGSERHAPRVAAFAFEEAEGERRRCGFRGGAARAYGSTSTLIRSSRDASLMTAMRGGSAWVPSVFGQTRHDSLPRVVERAVPHLLQLFDDVGPGIEM